MNLKEIGCEGVDWVHLTLDRDQWRALVDMLMKLFGPYNAGKFLTR
jgi:hypothetical protein